MLLYHNKLEYSRVIEVLSVTEEGIFLKDKTPEDYGGAVLNIEVVHQITLCDAAGCIEILKFENPAPLDKEKTPMDGAAITIDGDSYREGSSPAREWTTRSAAKLPQDYRAKAEITKGIMASDGTRGTDL